MLIFKKSVLVALAGVFAFFSLTFAQGVPSYNNQNFILTIAPEFPPALSLVTASIQSFSFDVNRVETEWRLNGKTGLSGRGEKSFSFETGPLGSQTLVEARVRIGGQTLIQQVAVRPADVDILWYGKNSAVPPFYRGRSLPSVETDIKITAIPHLVGQDRKRLSESGLIYNWTLGLDNQIAASGAGRDSFTFTNNFLRDEEAVGVTVSTVSQSLGAKSQMNIPVAAARVLLVKVDAGGQENVLKSGGFITGGSAQIKAVPYYFSANKSRSDLVYEWRLNGEQTNAGDPYNDKIFVDAGGRSGEVQLSVFVKNIKKLFQSAGTNLNLRF